MSQYLKHKRSSVVINGAPKLPSASALSIGEIAINFAEGYETLSIKNNNNGIASFSSDNINDKKYISSGAVVSAISALTVALEEDEYTIGQTFNDHNQRLTTLEELSIPDSTSDLTNDSGFITSANAKTQIESYHYISGYTETDPTVPAWAKAESKPTYTASEVGALATGTTLDNIADGSTRKLSGYFDDAEYDSNTKRINFKNGGTVKDYIDATDFIKDGMVSSVTVSNGNLVLTFNTDAGREDISLTLTQIFNPNNYYDKDTADGKFLSGYTETDPTVPSWAKESTKPSYTASEVGAMATSERNNYLPTGTTLDSVADGTARKLSNYSLTGHSHTASEVGALPTGTTLDGIADGTTRKLSNYSLTGHSHTAAEVGALPTGTTLDNIADGTTRKLSNYSLTGHTHDNYSLTSHTHSNYSLTSHTHTAAEVGALPDTTDIPTQASIENSGFTKNVGTLTGVTINGSAATVSNGNASFNIELGGSGSGLPSVSASDNGKILQVVNGQWTLVTPTVVYTGNGTPDNLLGNNGDIYLQTS